MGDTGISWTDKTWNCVRGCSRVSAGCTRCYAEVQAARIVRMGNGKPTPYDDLVKLVTRDVRQIKVVNGEATGDFRTISVTEPRWTGKVVLDPKALALPLSWRAPRRVFVNSMSDLFHESLTNEQIAAVFGVMAACPQHTFQVLTKRAKRMREWFEWAHGDPLVRLSCALTAYGFDREVHFRQAYGPNDRGVGNPWPLVNVWLGVSVENQEAADERIPELLRTPAAVRFLSCEPLIGEVDLDMPRCDDLNHDEENGWFWDEESAMPFCSECDVERSYGHWLHLDGGIDWVIAGCESGHGARPCSVEWLRSLRDQTAAAGVAFFLKQATQVYDEEMGRLHPRSMFGEGSKRKPGCVIELPYLDGVQHAAFPEVGRAP